MGGIISLVPAPLDAVAERWWEFSTKLLRSVIATGVGLATGKGEVERICGRIASGGAGDGGGAAEEQAAMTRRLLRVLRLSSSKDTAGAAASSASLPIEALILRPAAFDAPSILERVATVHRIGADQALVRRNLARCLGAINNANRVAAAALALKATKYDASNPEHEAMLESLWAALKPGVTRRGGRVTEEWGEIGFQGKDPATDFRGMGLLGLHQLLSFARTRPDAARQALLESHHPRRFFPFAATGINVSGFVLSLLAEERLLDDALVEQHAALTATAAAASSSSSSSGGGGDGGKKKEKEDAALVEKGLELVDGVYADVYQAFHARWVAADPENVMAFPRIFDEVKTAYRRQLRAARGDLSLLAAVTGY